MGPSICFLNKLAARGSSDLTSAYIPDMSECDPESSLWLVSFVLNSGLGGTSSRATHMPTTTSGGRSRRCPSMRRLGRQRWTSPPRAGSRRRDTQYRSVWRNPLGSTRLRISAWTAALFALMMIACSDVAAPNAESTGSIPTSQGTILLPVSEVSWALSGDPPTDEQIPPDIRALIPLVPVAAPRVTSSGVASIRIDRSEPGGNIVGTSITEWESDGTSYWITVKWASAQESATCDERLENVEQNGRWEVVAVRGLPGCATEPGPGILIVEWTEKDVTFHYEAGGLSTSDAVEWLGTWWPLR